jgi:histidinol-phosphate/aromatic aminotransferase/cobyric acid decarboxylase-like protein
MIKKAKAKAKTKKRTILKEQAQQFLAKVPEENIFWCCDGTTFRDIKELADALAAMSEDVFIRHVNSEKNDFYNWVRDVIGDEELADELVAAKTRAEAAGCVSARFALLTASLA